MNRDPVPSQPRRPNPARIQRGKGGEFEVESIRILDGGSTRRHMKPNLGHLNLCRDTATTPQGVTGGGVGVRGAGVGVPGGRCRCPWWVVSVSLWGGVGVPVTGVVSEDLGITTPGTPIQYKSKDRLQ